MTLKGVSRVVAGELGIVIMRQLFIPRALSASLDVVRAFSRVVGSVSRVTASIIARIPIIGRLVVVNGATTTADDDDDDS